MEPRTVKQGLHFILDKGKSNNLKDSLERIKYLFNAVVELDDVFNKGGQAMQWIYVQGEENDAKQAKNYIVALTSPELEITLKNIWGHPLFTSSRQDSIERTTCAVLSKGNDDSLVIKGTELSIALAQSMIDDMFREIIDVDDFSQSDEDLADTRRSQKHFLDEQIDEGEGDQYDLIFVEDEKGKKGDKAALNQNNSAFTPLLYQTMAVSSSMGPQCTGSFSAHQTSSSQLNKFNSHTMTLSDYDPDHTPVWRPVSETSDSGLKSNNSKKVFAEQQRPLGQTSWPSHSETGCNSLFASALAVSPSTKSGQNLVANNSGCHGMSQKGDGSVPKADSNTRYQHLFHEDRECEVEMEMCGPDIVSKPSVKDKAQEQETYLRDLGLNLHYSADDIEKGLNKYNMDDVIKPADFIKTLNYIKTQRHGGDSHIKRKGTGKMSSSAPATEVISVSDADESVIYIGSVSADVRSINVSSDHARRLEVENKSSDLGNRVICRDPVDNITITSGEDTDDVDADVPPILQEQKSRRRRPLARKAATGQKAVSNREISGPRAPVDSADRNPVTDNVQVSEEDQMQRNVMDEPTPERPFRKDLRYIVIDGSNVAMAHGDNRVFSVEGLRICINYFRNRGHDRITAFVSECRRYSSNPMPMAGRQLLERLNKDGYVKFTPARRNPGGETVVSYDDRYILNLAEKEEGIIVSNDQFRDLCLERRSYQKLVQTCLLPFMFVGNHFMPPDDPLGRHGPHLDQFLQTTVLRQVSQPPPRPYNTTRYEFEDLPKVVDEIYSEEVSKNFGKKVNRQGTGGNKDVKSQPFRSRAATEQLFKELASVFPEPEQKSQIRKILNNHKQETDLVRLTNYCADVFFRQQVG